MEIPVHVRYSIKERKVWDVHVQASFGQGYWSHAFMSKAATCQSLQQAKDVVNGLVAAGDVTTEVVISIDEEQGHTSLSDR
jgi:hypothetical protein